MSNRLACNFFFIISTTSCLLGHVYILSLIENNISMMSLVTVKVIVFDIIQYIFMLYLFLVVIDINAKMGKIRWKKNIFTGKVAKILLVFLMFTPRNVCIYITLYGLWYEYFRSSIMAKIHVENVFYCTINISGIEITYW